MVVRARADRILPEGCPAPNGAPEGSSECAPPETPPIADHDDELAGMAGPLAAAQQPDGEAQRIAKTKTDVARLAIGGKASLTATIRAGAIVFREEKQITLGNGEKITGHLGQVGDDFFTIMDTEGQSTKIAYPDVLRVTRDGVAPTQTATSFAELRLLIKPGEKISVTDSTGKTQQGQVAELSPSSIRLLVGGSSKDLPEADVVQITQRRGGHKGVTIGALSGLGVGAFLAVLVCTYPIAECGTPRNKGSVIGGIGIVTAVGAGIGAALDAVIRHDLVVYKRPGDNASPAAER